MDDLSLNLPYQQDFSRFELWKGNNIILCAMGSYLRFEQNFMTSSIQTLTAFPKKASSQQTELPWPLMLHTETKVHELSKRNIYYKP